MSIEQEQPQYFANFESEHELPDLSWERVLDERLVYSPLRLRKILGDAKKFLMTEPGPNLKARKQLVPGWLDYWGVVLLGINKRNNEEDLTGSKKVMGLDQVSSSVKSNFVYEHSGVLFVAGAEGHAGHTLAANTMGQRLQGHYPGQRAVTWVFEQDEYLLGKARRAPFLSLPVRLSMWAHHPSIDILTVSDLKPLKMTSSDHYQGLFNQLGVKYSFADEQDPHREEKIARGVQDGKMNLVIPHLDTARTTLRVERLMPGDNVRDELSLPIDIFLDRGGEGMFEI